MALHRPHIIRPKSARRKGQTLFTFRPTPLARAGLDKLMQRTGFSESDVTNRAISIMAYLDREFSSGKDLLVYHDGITQRVVFVPDPRSEQLGGITRIFAYGAVTILVFRALRRSSAVSR
jgi:hypothetical protein